MKGFNPVITTIIPTYCRPQLLSRAMRSVLQQTYPDIQVCVYDNASGDETASVVNEIAQKDIRINYYCHPENTGAFNNFQYGLKNVHSTFFSILSDDDVLCPEFYETAIKWFEKYPEAGFVSMGVLNANLRGDIFPDGAMSGCKIGLYKPFDGLMKMLLHKPPTWTGTLFRKSILSEAGFPDETVGAVGDMEFMLRAASKVPFVYDSKPGGIFIPASLAKTKSARSSPELIWPGGLKMISNLTSNIHMPEKDRRHTELVLTSQMNSRLFDLGIAAIIRGDFEEARMATYILNTHCNCIARSKLLVFTLNICRLFPPLHFLIVQLYNLRSSILRCKNRQNAKMYAQYKSLLKV